MSSESAPLRKGPSGPRTGISDILTATVVPDFGTIASGTTGVGIVPSPFPPGSINDGDVVCVSLQGNTILPDGTAIAYTRALPNDQIQIGLFNGSGGPVFFSDQPMSIAVIRL